jgi:D-alanyl-D-alanine carboxypeptidase (penicillin-binding protein 5/6)
MQNSTLFRRAAALLLTAALALTLVLPGLAAYEMPIQTVNEGESVYLFNADIDKPILEQNADQQRYIASLTKMMTALLFLESGKDMNAEITIPASLTQEFKDIQNANGSTINLRIGETVRRIDLLYGLLVASANDAASVIASDVSDGDLTAFVARMNQRAKELGCTNTSFTCVHGLYDYGNVSSAHDLALIAKACAENETYMQVANTLSYTLPATNLHQNERTITSTNLMLNPEYPYYRDYIRGMKTGFTTLAGRCYVTFAQKDGHTYGLVVLGSDLDNIYREASEILDWAFASFSDRELVDTETPLTTAPLKKCRSYEEVELYAAAPVSGYGHADDKVTFTYDLQENISATVKDGAVLGTATVYLDGYEVGTVDLVTHQEYVSDFRTDLQSTLLLMAALIVLLAVLSFFTLVAGGGSLNLGRRRKARRR